MTILPDTSIWVDFLRLGTQGPAAVLDRYLDDESVLVCGPVMAELLAGAGPTQVDELWLAVGSLPWAELDHAGWRHVGEVAGRLRSTGRAVPLTDVVIAVAAARAGASVWSRDEDFVRIQSALPQLKLHLPA